MARSGSRREGTHKSRSDLDVIFCTSQDQPEDRILDEIYLKAYENLKKTADMNRGTDAIHIDYRNPLIKIDLMVLLYRLLPRYRAIYEPH